MSAPRIILVVCTGSVTRALLVSLLTSNGDDVNAFDSVPRAIAALGKRAPQVAILEAAIVRANPEVLERLKNAWREPVGVILADRAYADERRGNEDLRAFGAAAFVSIPPDAASMSDALRRAGGGGTGASVHVPPPSIPAAEESKPPIDSEQMARYIERLCSRMDTLDAYQLLRVSPTATLAEIRAAFRERALEFHPDRVHSGLDEQGRERVYQIFKRISWAFRKVGEANARREYDASRPKRS